MIQSFQMFLENTRTTQLSEDSFLEALKENCKNFSFDNDLLWRFKQFRTSDLQLFEPKSRKLVPIAFPKYFDRIAEEPNYPVKRKQSLIGGTSKEICRYLFSGSSDSMYMVIPFDNSEIIFCPVFDLWAAADSRKGEGSELVNKKPIEDGMFLKVNYNKDFKIPYDELSVIADKYNVSKRGGKSKPPLSWIAWAGDELGYEFFTSSNCLLINENKVNWLKSKLEN